MGALVHSTEKAGGKHTVQPLMDRERSKEWSEEGKERENVRDSKRRKQPESGSGGER